MTCYKKLWVIEEPFIIQGKRIYCPFWPQGRLYDTEAEAQEALKYYPKECRVGSFLVINCRPEKDE